MKKTALTATILSIIAALFFASTASADRAYVIKPAKDRNLPYEFGNSGIITDQSMPRSVPQPIPAPMPQRPGGGMNFVYDTLVVDDSEFQPCYDVCDEDDLDECSCMIQVSFSELTGVTPVDYSVMVSKGEGTWRKASGSVNTERGFVEFTFKIKDGPEYEVIGTRHFVVSAYYLDDTTRKLRKSRVRFRNR